MTAQLTAQLTNQSPFIFYRLYFMLLLLIQFMGRTNIPIGIAKSVKGKRNDRMYFIHVMPNNVCILS
jgi:hypothetical protein